MAKAIRIPKEVDEGAIIFHASDRAVEDFADFSFTSDVFDHLAGLVDHFLVGVINRDGSVFFDVDVSAVAFANHALNRFAAFADHIADLIGSNLEAHHLRSPLGNFLAGFRDDGSNLFADFRASFVRLREGFA